MEQISKINKNDFFVIICATLVAILCVMPFIASLSYSIDDYHLWYVYDINWDTMGYNFYSTGRIVEGAIAQLLYWLNIQPFNRPIGLVLFACSLALMGMQISKVLGINELSSRIIIALLFVINPFFTEIYYYSMITVYSGFAVICLYFGVKFSLEYYSTSKKSQIIWAILFYYMSLGIYQIFYPIALFLLIAIIVKDLFDRNLNWKKYIIYLTIYFSAFIIFYLILKVMFYLCPPSLAYDGVDIVQFVKSLFHLEYWISLKNIIILYMGNNTFNSKIVFMGLNILLSILLVIYILLEKSCRSFFKSLVVIIYMILAPAMCFGLGLARLSSISGRSLTSFGIYEATFFIISLSLINSMSSSAGEKWKKALFISFSIVIFVNGSLCGKAINNVLRLNMEEENMVNRMVYRMEENEEFTGMETLVVYGAPFLGNFTDKGLGDYGSPASTAFSKVLLFNEVSGYKFELPNDAQYEEAMKIIENMHPWPAADSIQYVDGMFIVWLYW